LVFGGVGLYLLAEFKENLPIWFYNALLYVIYIVFVTILVFFVILITRAAFGEWLENQIQGYKQRRYRRKLARRLLDKWLELSELIQEILKEEDREPTSAQSEKYFNLHLWFIANRPRFLVEWHQYNRVRTNSAHDGEYWDNQRDLGFKVFMQSASDPFSYFSEPLSANVLIHHLRDESLNSVQFVLEKLTTLTYEFYMWVSR
jgi:hypothetical protein